VPKKVLRLAIFDIDGTLRRVRDPWIHLHEHLGVIEQAQDFLTLWGQGKISYEEWANLDASLWRGFPRERIVGALETNPFRMGAGKLIDWFTSREIPCVGISSGLSIFNDITARTLGIAEVISNVLHFEGNNCLGEISVQVQEHNKAGIMEEVLERYGARAEESVAFGDGTADIPLLKKAGLGVAICPVNDQVRNSTQHVVTDEPIDGAIALVESHFGIA
jgi:phosphoserine phosphatase